MRSSNQVNRRVRFLPLLLIAALVVVGRVPFLIHADRFFDSDEAVEGLMARHVLQGEHPAFLWGQRYKGVPEVYLAAAVFAVAGPGVVALKSVTLGCFALFVALQFALVERLFSRAVAWLATALLVLGPPSLVLWSLSANAEIVLTMLAGTIVYLGFDVWRRTGSRVALGTACASFGAGLWVQQFILYYVAALAIAVLWGLPRRRAIVGGFISTREIPAWGRALLSVLAAAGAAYLLLGAMAFFTGGFDVAVANGRIGVHHPQKLWQIGGGLFLLWAVIRSVWLMADPRVGPHLRPNVLLASLTFAAGYAPALAGHAMGGGSAPIGRADLNGVTGALSPIVHDVVPILFGFRSPTAGWLDVPLWLGLSIVIAVGASILALRGRPFTPVFHLLVMTTPLLFLLSGSFVDAQSYRYLMPGAGALSVVMALGISTLFRRSRVVGAALLVALVVLFALEQRAWYRQLTPDTQSAALLDCLDRAGVRAAFADYWVSYKLTFLSGERIIVAPNSGADRYPPYRERVQLQPSAPTIPATLKPSCVQDILSSQ